MLLRPPINLNKQSQEATISLIRGVLQQGIKLTEVGNTFRHAMIFFLTARIYIRSLVIKLSGIDFTVTTKADSKCKTVGAASVAAKVTRDAWIEGWVNDEDPRDDPDMCEGTEAPCVKRTWSSGLGSGYPSGASLHPNTKTWVKDSLERIFGYPSIARFSWTTIKVALDDRAHAVECFSFQRIDDGQSPLLKAFENGVGHDKDRCKATKDLYLSSVSTL
ncbi:hypothetical protein BGW80DRAFT_1252584 [Lactifluus volemus]|nr:hypothetical protein BGW80DRAFT_1252584 [Lactifluus volemus]